MKRVYALILIIPLLLISSIPCSAQYLQRFSFYEPNYLIAGEEDAKVQLSFKYDLTHNFHFGFRQLMFWEIYEHSAPFRDINYRSELIYKIPFKWGVLKEVHFGIWAHESNGRDIPISRSQNWSYLRLIFKKNIDKRNFVYLETQINQFHKQEHTSMDEYRGFAYFQLGLEHLKYDKNKRWNIAYKMYLGAYHEGGARVSHQVDFDHEISFLPLRFYAQYYNGYREEMLDYREHTEEIRVGIGLFN